MLRGYKGVLTSIMPARSWLRNGRCYALRGMILCPGFLQNSYSRLDHFAERRGIFAHHALRALRALRPELLRRIPCRAKIRAIHFVEQPSTVLGCARSADAAWIQFLPRSPIL